MTALDAVRVRHYFDTLPRTDDQYEAPPFPATTTPPCRPTPCAICLEPMDWVKDTIVESKVR